MARAPFQVLVFPYRLFGGELVQYAVFRRLDADVWQGISGGGEDGESPEQAARREAFEEAGISENAPLLRLDSIASIPAIHFADYRFWGNDVYVVAEYSFGVEIGEGEIRLSGEHRDYEWLSYEEAVNRLKWDSNKTALWELHRRLSNANRV